MFSCHVLLKQCKLFDKFYVLSCLVYTSNHKTLMRLARDSLLTEIQLLILGTIFTLRRYASAVYAVVMCPSVCRFVHSSVTRRFCIRMAKYRITQTTPYDSPGTLVF